MNFRSRMGAILLLVLLGMFLWQKLNSNEGKMGNEVPFNEKDDPFVVIPGVDSHIRLSELQRLYLPNVPGSFVTPEKLEVLEAKKYPPIQRLPFSKQMRILVTGGAGFVGSHLVDRLMLMGHQVIVLDNLFTGRKRNIQHWIGHPHFEFFDHDVVLPIYIEVDRIYHLASPASPPHYQYNPIKTLKTNLIGTVNMLGLARRVKARILIASTSEIYGDPKEHPQKETYWGYVNPIGPRACYDEGKRVAETLAYSYYNQEKVQVRVIRIFNTYGPRMLSDDGRVVSNFITQAIQGKNLTIYGDGLQTRSFQFVHDLVSGMISLMESSYNLPVNIGNPEEYTIDDFATFIKKEIPTKSKVVKLAAVTDDPQQRKPDITRAGEVLGWKPTFPVHFGIKETVQYFKAEFNLYENWGHPGH